LLTLYYHHAIIIFADPMQTTFLNGVGKVYKSPCYKGFGKLMNLDN